VGFLTVTIAIIATSILVLWGLRGTAAESTIVGKFGIQHSPRGGRTQIMSLVTEQHAMRNPLAVLH
jgi:hypothetical protein